MFAQFRKVGQIVLMLGLVSTLLIACQAIQAQPQAASPAEVVLFTLTMSPGETRELEALGPNPSEEEIFLHAALGKEVAYYSDDLERFLSFFAEDTVSMPPDALPTEGKDALREGMQAFLDEYEISGHSQLVSVEIHGDYATRYLQVWDTLTPKAGGEPILSSGSCVVGWQKINGEWKIVWEIWNSEPLPMPQ
jgi:ketosteroid isomerase-like protein